MPTMTAAMMTPHQLWEIRTGRRVQEETMPMRHGSELEPLARIAYEQATTNIMEPIVVEDGDYSASLDGMTLDGELILEIKCPFNGDKSELWKQVDGGSVPECYRLQVQHQLMVSGAQRAHLYVFDGQNGLVHAIEPDETLWPQIRAAWDTFMRWIALDTPPPLSDRDRRIRTDEAWTLAASRYIEAKASADNAASVADEARAALVALAEHCSEEGDGVVVSRYWKAGAVDYKRVPQLQSVNLEDYRGPPRLETRVSLQK